MQHRLNSRQKRFVIINKRLNFKKEYFAFWQNRFVIMQKQFKRKKEGLSSFKKRVRHKQNYFVVTLESFQQSKNNYSNFQIEQPCYLMQDNKNKISFENAKGRILLLP